MNSKPLSFTWKGLVFGAIIYGCFVAGPIILLFEHLFFELNGKITGALVGASIALLLGLNKMRWYWNWADRVMAKFFSILGYNSGA